MRFRALLIGLVLLLLTLAALGPLDRWAFDMGTRLLRGKHPQGGQNVVLVGIDEATERAFPEPLALWHRHLGTVLGGLALAQPRAVGIDLNLPARDYDNLVAGSNAALLGGLIHLKQACPVVLGITVDETGQPRPMLAPFQTVAGPEGTGFVTWEQDPDHCVRRFTEHPHHLPEAIPTLAGQLARRLGLPVGAGWLDYRSGAPVPYTALWQVEQWAARNDVAALRQAFQGKVVLVGSVLPFVDRHQQIVDLNGWGEDNQGFAPGVLLHLQALRNLLGRGFIQPVPWAWTGLLALGLATLGWLLGRRPALGGLGCLASLALLGAGDLGVLELGHFLAPTLPMAGLLAGFAGRAGAEAWDKLRERRRLRDVFGGYVSPAILAEILAGRLKPGLRGDLAELCVLFSDVRGYTTLSEGRRPEAVIELLNRYFDRMAPAIHAHGGTVDKFLGDGIMAHFGHPASLQEPCRAAFEAARLMLQELDDLNRELTTEGLPALRIGIGLHAGEAVVGYIGSRERHEYTAIGDTVNVASRIEGLTKEAGYPLLMTAPVAERLGADTGLVPLGERALKGHTPLAVFGWRPAALAPSLKTGDNTP
jgi:class 3 adenylate cyclase/CHASE2 domain-containing sensor protein